MSQPRIPTLPANRPRKPTGAPSEKVFVRLHQDKQLFDLRSSVPPHQNDHIDFRSFVLLQSAALNMSGGQLIVWGTMSQQPQMSHLPRWKQRFQRIAFVENEGYLLKPDGKVKSHVKVAMTLLSVENGAPAVYI